MTGRAIATADERIVAQRTFQPAALNMDQPLILSVSRETMPFLVPGRASAIFAAIYLLFAMAAWLTLASSQRRQREEALRSAEMLARNAAEAERLALVLGGGDLALWDADVTTGQGTVNERWYTMLGYTQADISPNLAAWDRWCTLKTGQRSRSPMRPILLG